MRMGGDPTVRPLNLRSPVRWVSPVVPALHLLGSREPGAAVRSGGRSVLAEALADQLPKEGHLHRSIKLRDGCSRTMFHSDKRLDTNTRKIQVPDGVEISVEPEAVHV